MLLPFSIIPMLLVSLMYSMFLLFSYITSPVLAVYVISFLADEPEPVNHSAFSKEPAYVHGISTLHGQNAEISSNLLIPE